MMSKDIGLFMCFVLSVLGFVSGFNAHVVAGELRDPSAPLFSTANTVKKLAKNKLTRTYVLSSVFIGENKRLAIINNKTYQEGDSIGGYKIKKININEVLMSSSNLSKVLKMYPVDQSGFSIK